MMVFDEWTYLWPPRPEKAVSKALLQFYENQGWLAQIKLNGTCNVMAVAPDRQSVRCMSRHNDEHRAWHPSAHTADAFKKLPGDGWYVFLAELMHSKVPGIKDINYVHDVLVTDGDYLVGTALADRQALLFKLFDIDPKAKGPISHHVIDEHTWLARPHTTNFSKLFESLTAPEYEGLVLKNPNSKLVMCSRQSSNSGWQVKCRKPLKNFGF
jgi:hypothetical protein